MLTWMHCIGVVLDAPGIPSSTRTRCLSTLFGLAVFTFNVYRNGILFSWLIVFLLDPKNIIDVQRQIGFVFLWI